MKFKTWAILLLLASFALPAWAVETEPLKTRQELISYAAGVEMARSFRRQEVAIDPELLAQGMRDVLAGRELRISERDRRAIMREVQSEAKAKMARKRQLEAGENRKKEEEFLAANKAKEGVISLPSGVQYQVIKAADGRIPTEADSVECNYLVSHLDGSEFDSSDPGKPVLMKVAKLLPGWKEAMTKMPEGSIWQIYLPSRLAYGEQGAGYEIGPNEMLVFKVELLAVK